MARRTRIQKGVVQHQWWHKAEFADGSMAPTKAHADGDGDEGAGKESVVADLLKEEEAEEAGEEAEVAEALPCRRRGSHHDDVKDPVERSCALLHEGGRRLKCHEEQMMPGRVSLANSPARRSRRRDHSLLPQPQGTSSQSRDSEDENKGRRRTAVAELEPLLHLLTYFVVFFFFVLSCNSYFCKQELSTRFFASLPFPVECVIDLFYFCIL